MTPRLPPARCGSANHHPDRRAFMIDALGRGEMHAGDAVQGFEQLYGLSWRDVTTYRPFVEFCMGLPVDLFVHDGQNRWLARELSKGPSARGTAPQPGERHPFVRLVRAAHAAAA